MGIPYYGDKEEYMRKEKNCNNKAINNHTFHGD